MLVLADLSLQPQLVSDDGNELRISRLALVVLDRIAEQIIDGFQAAAIPRYFDGVADRPLHAARRGMIVLRDGRIQLLGDGTQKLHIFHNHQDGIPQILISFDVSRNTHFMNDIRDLDFQIFLPAITSAGQDRLRILHLSLLRLIVSSQLIDPLHQNIKIERLDDIILCA